MDRRNLGSMDGEAPRHPQPDGICNPVRNVFTSFPSSSLGTRSLKLLLAKERSTNKQELDRQGFPTWSLGTSQITGTPIIRDRNNYFGIKRNVGCNAKTRARPGFFIFVYGGLSLTLRIRLTSWMPNWRLMSSGIGIVWLGVTVVIMAKPLVERMGYIEYSGI